MVFHQGDPGEALYVVLSGQAQAIRYHEDGRGEEARNTPPDPCVVLPPEDWGYAAWDYAAWGRIAWCLRCFSCSLHSLPRLHSLHSLHSHGCLVLTQRSPGLCDSPPRAQTSSSPPWKRANASESALWSTASLTRPRYERAASSYGR